MLYPELSFRWSDDEWYRCLDMVKSFGFNTFEFWLEPRLFCREGLEEEYGVLFSDQIRRVIAYAHSVELDVFMLLSLATVGSDWKTLCPNIPDEWDEIEYLWQTVPDGTPIEIRP